MKRTYTLCIAAFAGLLPLVWLASEARADDPSDSPIFVGDGSITVEHQKGDLKNWKVINRNTLQHPQQGKVMGAVDVTGPGAKSATCEGRGRCVIEMKWTTGQSIRVVARQAGSKALHLESTGVTFDDKAWDKSKSMWKYNLPATATPTVTIRDGATNGQPETICQGKACKLVVHYK